MKTALTTTIGILLFLSTPLAHAETTNPDGRGFGLGAQAIMGTGIGLGGGTSTLPAISGTYDLGSFYLDAIAVVAVVEGPGDVFGVGADFYYILHQTKSTDFSIGGGGAILATNSFSPDTEIGLLLEGGGKIRAFALDNLAFTLNVGVGAVILDNVSGFGTVGRLGGSMGVVYFF
ncbi:MAG: hypothetical protein R3C68_08795 [Myxococcota bacterium]